MSEIKPVYQASESGASWYEIDASLYETYKTQDWIQTRILYPAAAYEAIQKENAELKATISNLTKAYERESNDCLKALEERDYWYEKADSLADKISECFDVPVGEHSNVNCPIVESMKILCGEYVTKFDKQIEALKSENEALRKQVEEHKEWHMMRDEMRKALEAQMGISNKWQS